MFKKVEDAYKRIVRYINHTPVMTSRTLNKKTNANCYLKCENFQRIGAFKFRGAINALLTILANSNSPDKKDIHVIASSSGNHAQALSLAANILNVKATIVMPSNAPKVKVTATKGYGADIVFCGNNPGDREKMTNKLIEKYGYILIHPSNDLNVIQGAGTAAYELIKEVGNLDYIFAPVGGGGLISGTAIASKGLFPNIKVIAVEPKNADDAYRSLRDNRIYPSENPNTIADGLRTSLGSNTFQIIKDNVDSIITVTEKEIIDSMEFLWTRMKLVVEPSGAVSTAGVLSNPFDLKNKRVGIIISGGNIDLTDFFDDLRNEIEEYF